MTTYKERISKPLDGGWRCPVCPDSGMRCLDSRATEAGKARRRRYQCTSCKLRFTTRERRVDEDDLHTSKAVKIAAIQSLRRMLSSMLRKERCP